MDLQPIQAPVLLGGQDHAAGKGGADPARVTQESSRQPVHALIGEISHGANRLRLAQQPDGLGNAVAAQVVQAAAQRFPAHANVG